MKKQVIIFDFDGTLADVLPAFKEIYQELAPKYGLKIIDDDDYLKLRQQPIWKIMWKIGLKPWRLEGLLKDGRRLFANKKAEVNLFDGIADLIKKLDHDGHKLYILSSNRERTIRLILERYDLNEEVVIMKRPSFFGKSSSIKKLIKHHNYKRSDVWMIGDEVRDLKGGKGAKVNTISVSWGLQGREILSRNNPDYLADKVKEIEDIFKN